MKTHQNIHDIFELLASAVHEAADQAARQGGVDLRNGHHDKAQRAVTQTRAMRQFARTNIPELKRLWRSVERNRIDIPPEARQKTTSLDDLADAILLILKEAGGTLRTADVLDGVYFRMKDRFLPGDFAPAGTGQTRWKASARHARDRMVRQDLLSQTAPKGTWQLTEKGYEAADQARRPRTEDPSPAA